MPNWSNTTVRDAKIKTYDLDLATNYSWMTDKPSKAQIRNDTCTYDQSELVEYHWNQIPIVNTTAAIVRPAPKVPAVSYQVQNDCVYLDTSDPVVGPVTRGCKMYLTCVHDLSGYFTDAILTVQLGRLLGYIPSGVDADGNVLFKLSNLAAGAIRPKL